MRGAAVFFLVTAFLGGSGTWAGPSLQELERSVEVQPKNPALRFNLGLAYFQAGTYKKAEAEFAEAEKLDPKDGEARILHGISLQALGRNADAEKALEAGVKLKPDSFDGHKYLAQSYLASGSPEKALREQERCASLKPQLAEPWVQMGMIQADEKKLKDAEKSLSKALALEPGHAGALAELASVLIKQEKFLEAQEAAGKAVAADPKSTYALHSLGTAQYKTGQGPKALLTYSKLERLQPKDPIVQARLGMIAYESKDYEKARTHLRKAAELDPKDALSWKNLGTACYVLEDYKGAVGAYQKAADLDPSDTAAKTYRDQFAEEGARTYLQRASQSYVQGDYSAATGLSRKALELEPGNAQAKEYLDLGVKKAGEMADAHARKGREALNKGDRGRALDEWNQALALVPGHKEAAASISRLKLDRRAQAEGLVQAGLRMQEREDLKGALGSFRKAEQADSTYKEASVRAKETEAALKASAIANFDKGRAYQKKGDGTRAIAAFKASLADLEDPQVRKSLSDAQKETLDKEDKALSAKAAPPKEGVGSKDDAALQSLYMEGVSKYVAGQLEKAIETWNRVLAKDPDHQGAQRGVKQAQRELDELKKLGSGR